MYKSVATVLAVVFVVLGSNYYSYSVGLSNGVNRGENSVMKAVAIGMKDVKPLPVTFVENTPVAPQCVSRKYTVVRGDNLTKIARKEYGGRGYLYPLLAEVNKLTDPDMIFVGSTLTIPCCLCDLPVQATSARKNVTKTTEAEKKQDSIPAPNVTIVDVPKDNLEKKPSESVQVQNQEQKVSERIVTEIPEIRNPEPQKSLADEKSIILPEKQNPVDVYVPTSEIYRGTSPFVRSLPGSAWNSFGVTPLEKGNNINTLHVDQGFILARLTQNIFVVPYGAINVSKDSLGYVWDNKNKVEAGIKLVKSFPKGQIGAGTSYAIETRRGTNLDNDSRSSIMAFTDGWFGWDQASRTTRSSFLSSIPGTTWWSLGNTSPFEGNNLIGISRLEQGITIAKAKGVSLIPQVWGQAGFDTQGNPWNNRYLYGTGLKVSAPWSFGVLSTTLGYECAKQYRGIGSSTSATCGKRFTVDVWTGWRKKIGGE